MKFRYWMMIYPFNLGDGTLTSKPTVFSAPPSPRLDGKVVCFDVEIPDDLFGTMKVEVSNTTPET